MIVYSPWLRPADRGDDRERIATLPADDWRSCDVRFAEPQPPGTWRWPPAAGGGGPARRHARRGGGRLDAAQPRGERRDHRLRRPVQVDPILAAANLELTGQDMTEIEAAN